MRIANYCGKSLESKAIRWLTRSIYSHTAFVFDEQTVKAVEEVKRAGIMLPRIIFPVAGAVVEAWNSGVRNVISTSAQHQPGTQFDLFDFKEPLSLTEEMQLVKLIHGDIGDPYNWTNVWRFVTKKPGRNIDDSWFCSEQVFQRSADIGRVLLARTQAWEVPPAWIPKSNLLKDPVRCVTS